MDDLQEKLIQIRKSQLLTRSKMAKKLGAKITANIVANLEAGRKPLRDELFMKYLALAQNKDKTELVKLWFNQYFPGISSYFNDMLSYDEKCVLDAYRKLKKMDSE